jgi:glycosyltransferase involved in cell wall biosynthesis
MFTPSISVIVPARNAELFIREAIESVQAQTLSVSEIIVVDDGSSDRTALIAQEAGALILSQPHRGISAARNAGINASKQEWLAFLDADDRWEDNKIEYQWMAIQRCPDVGMVSCDYYLVQPNSMPVIPDQLPPGRWSKLDDRLAVGEHFSYFRRVAGDFFTRFYPLPSTVMLRRNAVSAVGLFDESLQYLQDFEHSMRILANYSAVIVEQFLVGKRVHGDNHSRNVAGRRRDYLTIVGKMIDHSSKYPPGAGQIYRELVKKTFFTVERDLASHNLN